MAIEFNDMPISEIEAFVSTPRFAVFGTNRIDGPPHQTPVWFLYEAGVVYVSIAGKSIKHKHLRRDARVSICVPGEHPDARAVVFSGTAELFADGSDEWVDDIVWRLVRRYYDNDVSARSYLEDARDGGPGVLVSLRPEKIFAHNYN